MINEPFFTQFLKVSNFYTIGAIFLLIVAIFFLKGLKNKKVNFSKRMIIALVIGLGIGIIVDLIGGDSTTYLEFGRIEISTWYGLIGTGFLKLVQLLAIPVVFLSIIKVVVDVQGERLKTLTGKTFFSLLSTTAVSAAVGILVVKLYNLKGADFAGQLAEQKVESMGNIAAQSFPEFFLNLIPNNIMAVMGDNGSIVSVVIVAALFASAIRFLQVKKPEQVAPFVTLLDSLKVTVNSVLTNIIKLMPYGVVALVGNTIISNGLNSITGMLGFILALYTGVIIMLIIYVIILLVLGVSPIIFYKKAFTTLLFAFSSRSSVGTLPYTLKTLENDMGVSKETSNFVGTLGTAVGMNGCAGVFPAMLGVLIASAVGTEMTFSFYVLVIVVVTVGSIGIAGVPGTATVAATVTLNGLGYGHTIASIGAIFGIDPIIDMGRTMLNVAGSMVSAIMVDKWEGTFDKEAFSQSIETKE
ncbi:cation:dicarboxylate symporter family transporter [Vagococcus intermedius]|uniref:L-cystine uptake protein TcyP n=1 Tax=Vagococcus intermedius TaxID=2991418 RepID=A0AAF0I791_9ENTE|nr:cation:dicarboxylase symporter family transporter [Vagococcus intermedius]WEG74143.1 cation:dicarboxylase symporter family transporter [Vagococcus intermedius]WEG76222.1 cation:dicarboxylase symporter family transporter [Vagococcus intermedius]